MLIQVVHNVNKALQKIFLSDGVYFEKHCLTSAGSNCAKIDVSVSTEKSYVQAYPVASEIAVSFIHPDSASHSVLAEIFRFLKRRGYASVHYSIMYFV